MGQVLALALQSMQHDMKRVERIGVNVANAVTPGYKREMVVETPFANIVGAEFGMAGKATGAQMFSEGFEIATDNRTGTLKPTGQKLDLAISGEGFFEIKTPHGIAYTRLGSFQVDGQGRLVTLQGEPVMGKNGEVILNSNQPVISSNGEIFDTPARNMQNGSEQMAIAQLKIVQFQNSAAIHKDSHGLLVVNPDTELKEVKNPQIVQGHLENSNVSSMEEMVSLMQTMRHFESMQKIAQGYDDMMGTAIKKLGETS